MSTDPLFFKPCQAALAAWHRDHNHADAARFTRAFSPYCGARVRAALVHRHNIERYGQDAVQNILTMFLANPALANAEDLSYWNATIAHEVVDTIDETNGYRARRVFKRYGRIGRRFEYLGVDAQDIVPAGAAVDTPEASVEAAQTLRVVRGALNALPPLRRWAFIARQTEPLYLLTRREITLHAKRLKISRAALVALLESPSGSAKAEARTIACPAVRSSSLQASPYRVASGKHTTGGPSWRASSAVAVITACFTATSLSPSRRSLPDAAWHGP